MDELLAKITNLGYEIFGVILPGFIVLLFLIMFWATLGPLAQVLSFGHIPEFNLGSLASTIGTHGATFAFIVPLLVGVYFLGHILLWISRSGSANDAIIKDAKKRIWYSLLFRIPKPSTTYDDNLEPLLNAVSSKFITDGCELTWGQFFPVAKSYLSRNLAYSLVATYQNKYTLHRSITAAAAALFWLCVFTALFGVLTYYCFGVTPNWGLLAMIVFAAIVAIWGFSSSYVYHWKMFGNTIITESYSLIYGPRNDEHHQ